MTVAAGFGGRTSPYERVMSGRHAGPLTLEPLPDDADDHGIVRFEVERFLAAADATDHAVLARSRGPVLDVGCGPGRMVRAALLAGRAALGVDVSPAAVRRATAQGLPVLHRSVFDPLPREGDWGTVLLLDGNVGIGGDPLRLLARVGVLLAHDGRLLAECHPQPHRDRRFQAVVADADGRVGDPFGWAEVGVSALVGLAQAAGLRTVARWRRGGRRFVALAR